MKRFIIKHSILLSLILVLLSMAMIFYFSSNNAKESESQSGIFSKFIINIIFPDFENMAEESRLEIKSTVSFIIRKCAHFTEFALLGASLYLHTSAISRKKKLKFKGLYSFAIGTIYAFSDEIHQAFVPGRGPALRDVMVDSSGVLFGILIICIIFSIIKNKFLLQNR